MAQKRVTNILLVILVIAGVGISGYFVLGKVPLQFKEIVQKIPYLTEIFEKTWVEIEPIQCLGNPWEVEWLKSHDNNYSEYPRQEESQIIKNYYQKQGVIVFDVKSKQTHKIVCASCDCPRGDTLYLLVSDSDVNKMLELGYKTRFEISGISYKYIIVSLNIPYTPEGALSETEKAAQRKLIVDTREAIISDLTGDFEIYKTYETLPNFAIKADAITMKQLEEHSMVKSVQEDIAVPYN